MKFTFRNKEIVKGDAKSRGFIINKFRELFNKKTEKVEIKEENAEKTDK